MMCVMALYTYAQSPNKQLVRLYDPSSKPADANLEDLNWLVGTWEGDMDGITVEHIILDEKVRQFPGFVRAENDNQIAFYEITQFVEVGESVNYRVKHFTGELKGWEEQNEVIDRHLVAKEKDILFFDGISFKKINKRRFIVYYLVQDGDYKGNIIEIVFDKMDKE